MLIIGLVESSVLLCVCWCVVRLVDYISDLLRLMCGYRLVCVMLVLLVVVSMLVLVWVMLGWLCSRLVGVWVSVVLFSVGSGVVMS